jgi:hypothetical protein
MNAKAQLQLVVVTWLAAVGTSCGGMDLNDLMNAGGNSWHWGGQSGSLSDGGSLATGGADAGGAEELGGASMAMGGASMAMGGASMAMGGCSASLGGGHNVSGSLTRCICTAPPVTHHGRGCEKANPISNACGWKHMKGGGDCCKE